MSKTRPCLLCVSDTEHKLSGDASYGGVRGTYAIPLCEACWDKFEFEGVGADVLKQEIMTQVRRTGAM